MSDVPFISITPAIKGKSDDLPDEIYPVGVNNICVRGTIAEILPMDDKGNFRYLMQRRQGDSVIVVSDENLSLQIGDDLYATGYFAPHSMKSMPAYFEIDNGKSAQNRFKEQITRGAHIRSFGGESDVETSPFLAAFRRIFKGDKGVYSAKSDNAKAKTTIIKAAKESSDPQIAWLSELLLPVKKDGSILIIDPMAFALENARKLKLRGAFGDDWEYVFSYDKHLKKPEKNLRNALPEELKDAANGRMMGKLLYGDAAMYYRGMPELSSNGAEQFITIPYKAWQTSLTKWSGYSGFSARQFALKQIISPEVSRFHSIAHELAHGVQRRYGIAYSGHISHQHTAECFADSFAVLAAAKYFKSTNDIGLIGEARHASLLHYGFSHATGRAFDAALLKADELIKSGEIERLSGHQLLILAAKNAKEFAYSLDEMMALHDIRKKVCISYEPKHCREINGILNFLSKAPGVIDDKAGGVHICSAFEKALKEQKPEFFGGLKQKDEFESSFKALKNMAYNKSELLNDKTRKKAAELYKKDLENALETDGMNKEAKEMLFALERIEHANLGISLADIGRKRQHFIGWQKFIGDRRAALSEVSKKFEIEEGNIGSDKIAAQKEAAVTHISHNVNGSNMLVRAFALPPHRQLRIWINLLKAEGRVLKDYKANKNPVDLRRIGLMHKNRRLMAYALLSTEEGLKILRQTNHKGLIEAVQHQATTATKMVMDKRLDEELDALSKECKALGNDAAVTALAKRNVPPRP